jgi:cell wall-associated NlpC family hydrolase
VNERINRCASAPLSAKLRSVVQAALAAIVLLIASIALARPVPAQAASAAHETAAKMRTLVWRYALRQQGKPYIYGDDGPAGFDCSGLVYAAYRAAGIALPRTTYGMLASWRLVRSRSHTLSVVTLPSSGPATWRSTTRATGHMAPRIPGRGSGSTK